MKYSLNGVIGWTVWLWWQLIPRCDWMDGVTVLIIDSTVWLNGHCCSMLTIDPEGWSRKWKDRRHPSIHQSPLSVSLTNSRINFHWKFCSAIILTLRSILGTKISSIEWIKEEYGAELSLNSSYSGNLINHWSMNYAQFTDPVSHMCLAGAVVASWCLTQEVAGSAFYCKFRCQDFSRVCLYLYTSLERVWYLCMRFCNAKWANLHANSDIHGNVTPGPHKTAGLDVSQ